MSESSSEHRLDGVIAKYNRAKEQFDQLTAEMDAWFNAEPKPHSSVGAFDTDAWEWIERFQIIEKPPLRFGVLFGEVVHNLRSALDHLMWQVTLLDGGTPNDRTQFPIVRQSKAVFDRIAKNRIPGLSAPHRAIVEMAQPYRAGKKAAHRHPLAVLNTFSNIDKHRLVHPTHSFIAGEPGDSAALAKRIAESFEDPGQPPVIETLLAREGQGLVDGTPWLRLRFRREEKPPRHVDVSGEMTLGIALGDIGLNAKDFPQIAEVVLGLTRRFLADFPETVWTD